MHHEFIGDEGYHKIRKQILIVTAESDKTPKNDLGKLSATFKGALEIKRKITQ